MSKCCHNFIFSRTISFLILLLLILLVGSISAPVVRADGPEEICAPPIQPVVLSNPTVVTNCTQAGLKAALDGGGQISFDCGSDPVTIPLDSQLDLNPTKSMVLDGGGLITLDGQNKTRILYKGWHDPSLGPITVTVQNMRFINAKAPAGSSTGDHAGGAINVGHPGTRLHVINSTFENNTTTSINTADNQGGAIFVHNSYETVISGSVFEDNEAGNGGAFGGIATGLIVYNSHFTSNKAVDDSGGGIVKGHGGAIHLDGVTNSYNPDSNKIVDICGSLFSGNTAVRGGGAIKTTISDNKGTKATYQRSSFINNRLVNVPPTEGHGGAIYHIEDDFAGGTGEDNIEIRDSTFAYNYAYKQGGAAWILVRGNGTIVNSTFTENEASQVGTNRVGQGGALIISKGLIDIINSTFAANFATFQGGAIFAGGSDDPERVITLTSSIFYQNKLDPTHTNPVTTEWQGYHTNRELQNGGNNLQFPRKKLPDFDNDHNNLITSPASAILFEDPRLGPLVDNNGPTKTMALQPGSPAINGGNTAGCPSKDQRGATRSQCDIGAYEYVLTIERLDPSWIGRNEGTVTLYVYGAAFTSATKILWDGTELSGTQFVDSTTLKVSLDAGSLATGDVSISVTGSELSARTLHVVEFLTRTYLPIVLK